MPMQHSGVKPYLRKFAAYYYSRAASSEYRAESGWNIPDEDRRFLLEIGEWLKINGQAIYGAKVWKKSAEGPARIEEGRFTDGTAKKFGGHAFHGKRRECVCDLPVYSDCEDRQQSAGCV